MRAKLLLVLACVAAVLLGVFLAIPEPLIGPVGYEAVLDEMTEEEVEGIFRVPAGNYGAGGEVSLPSTMSIGGRSGEFRDYGSMSGARTFKAWSGQAWEVQVGFDQKGTVVYKGLLPLVRSGETLPEMFRRWLGL